MKGLEPQNSEIGENIKEYLADFEHLPYGIAIAKNDSFATIIQANSAFYQLIGHTKEQFLNHCQNHMKNILIDPSHPIVKEPAKKEDFDSQWDLRIRTADGSIVWLHDCAHYNARLDVFFLTFINITNKLITTDAHLSYEAFQTKHKILSHLSRYTSEHIIVTDEITDEIIYMNTSAMKLLNFHEEKDWLGKTYCDVIYGSLENVHPDYYKPITEDFFTEREYYNTFHKKYAHVKSKIITIPSLHRKMRLNILTDVSAQKKLEHKITLQKTLHDCIESLFKTTASNSMSEASYYDILKCLKKYYHADRSFFYKFKEGTYEIDKFYEIFADHVKKAEHSLPIIVEEQQIKLMQKLSQAKANQQQSIFESLEGNFKNSLIQLHKEYQIDTFTCVVLNDVNGNVLAFMGVTNPQLHEEDKELMELLSRFICMFIEHQQDQVLKEEALKLEAVSKTNVLELCGKNFQQLAHSKENITDSLNALCHHYDADFAVILSNNLDGSCSPSYVGGTAIPDLTALQNQASSIMDKWVKTFETHPEFISDIDFIDLNAPSVKRILHQKFGIYNFVVSPIKDAYGNISGLLFVNNFKLLKRSRLLVHIVAKNISDYLAKIIMHQKNNLEPLTKLTNKVATQKRISTLLAKEETGTLFVIDIDNFKKLNDTFGHHWGDQAIVDIADSLKQIFRSTDVVGRIGGDEFMVFSPQLMEKDHIQKKAQQILELCNKRYGKNGLTFELSASIGICPVTANGETFQSIYEKADYALYSSKKHGKNQYHIYNATQPLIATPPVKHATTNEMSDYFTMTQELKSALSDHRFVVHYQPIYHIPSKTFTQAEALVRIAKPNGSLLYPDAFIQAANATGLIVPMTYQVLKQVCYDFRKLLTKQPNTSLTAISINVPYLLFIEPDMEHRFMEILEKYAISPSQIKIEITERVAITDLDFMTQKMARMKEKGFNFELDDFGTDYSNLQVCIALPVSIIKLDRSVLLAALASKAGHQFCQHVLAGIAGTGRQTLVEGVETEEQLNWAMQCSCQYIQGYYFSKPLEFQTFCDFLFS